MTSTSFPTLLHALLHQAERQPARTAILSRRESLTYGQFVQRVFGLARFLKDQGVEEGDRVVISSNNSTAFPIAYYATHLVRAIAVPLSADMPSSSRREFAGHVAAKVALAESADESLNCLTLSIHDAASRDARVAEHADLPDASMIADILFTTGTTGSRKGVVLSHHNILHAARNICAFIGNSEDDIEAVPIPLSHSFGLGRLRCLPLVGNTLMIERGVVNAAKMVARMLAAKATGLALVPAGFEILRRTASECLPELNRQVRYIEIGSAPLAAESRDWLINGLPKTRICHHYGSTEASRSCFIEYHAHRDKLGSIGQAAPNVSVRVLDAHGKATRPGELGEIVVKGEMVMREYWRRPDLTRQALSTEGFHTSDLGSVDEDGFIRLLGRQTDLINVGGRKVVPDEVEDVLCGHASIVEAACVAMPDPAGILGECVRAFVVVNGGFTIDALRQWMQGRLEEYKLPCEIVPVPSLPRTSSGKLQRHLLRSCGSTETASNP